jgi:hypothetical protein
MRHKFTKGFAYVVLGMSSLLLAGPVLALGWAVKKITEPARFA